MLTRATTGESEQRICLHDCTETGAGECVTLSSSLPCLPFEAGTSRQSAASPRRRHGLRTRGSEHGLAPGP